MWIKTHRCLVRMKDPLLIHESSLSTNSKIRTSIFRKTQLFEINLGHAGFREYGLFMNYLNHCQYKHMVLMRKRTVSPRRLFYASKTYVYYEYMFNKEIRKNIFFYIFRIPPLLTQTTDNA